MKKQNNYISTIKPVTQQDLYDITLKSSNSKDKEIFIFEKTDMSDLFDKQKAETLRKNFLNNNIKFNQITNTQSVAKFTSNKEFVNLLMNFRYVPKDIYTIDDEILIFDNTVAIYNSERLLIIEDESFAKSQKQLFKSIWEQGHLPNLEFEYKPNHSFYNSLDFFNDKMQIIVWPDVDAKNSYKGMNKKEVEDYIVNIIKSDSYYDDSTYIITIIWDMDGDRMVDIWKFNENHVDDRSGPLGDVRLYREGKICKDLGLASGNTLLILGHEEKLRRQSKDLKSYLEGPEPNLPLEIMNGKDFFE
ncbi:MAG: hypothetical protein HRU03_01740 [Nanoarchaeales archaeon]|nr:hypothetical protein [Nanoarchaeales archaeon]